MSLKQECPHNNLVSRAQSEQQYIYVQNDNYLSKANNVGLTKKEFYYNLEKACNSDYRAYNYLMTYILFVLITHILTFMDSYSLMISLTNSLTVCWFGFLFVCLPGVVRSVVVGGATVVVCGTAQKLHVLAQQRVIHCSCAGSEQWPILCSCVHTPSAATLIQTGAKQQNHRIPQNKQNKKNQNVQNKNGVNIKSDHCYDKDETVNAINFKT